MCVYHTRPRRCRPHDHLFSDEEHLGRRQERVLPVKPPNRNSRTTTYIIRMNSEDYYKQGNAYRQQGDWQAAMNSYMEAIALNPDSPAVQAKEMLERIYRFYHKDTYNP